MSNKPSLHDIQRVVSTDSFFVVGGNPDGSGGGVIASCNSAYMAAGFLERAMELGYKNVRVLSACDFWKDSE